MATDRRGRRRRQRRHKARAKGHPVRLCSPRYLGREFEEMQRFVSEPQDCFRFVGGPADGKMQGWDGSPEWRVYEMKMDGARVWRRDDPLPEPTIHVYKIQLRREGRLFYEGRNRRERRLLPLMVNQHV